MTIFAQRLVEAWSRRRCRRRTSANASASARISSIGVIRIIVIVVGGGARAG